MLDILPNNINTHAGKKLKQEIVKNLLNIINQLRGVNLKMMARMKVKAGPRLAIDEASVGEL